MKSLNLEQVKAVSGGTETKTCTFNGVPSSQGWVRKEGDKAFMCNNGEWEQVSTPPRSGDSGKPSTSGNSKG